MKVPPKRKGNTGARAGSTPLLEDALNESPSEKEGKSCGGLVSHVDQLPLNESPSEKEGKFGKFRDLFVDARSLNESPSEKEGKLQPFSPHLVG